MVSQSKIRDEPTESAVEKYYVALERLKINRPIRVPKGTKITNSSVSKEAGCSSGAIRNDRADHEDIVNKIKKAAAEQPINEVDKIRNMKDKYKDDKDLYRERYERALGREVMLLKRLHELTQKTG